MTVAWRRFGRPALGIGVLLIVLVSVDPRAVLGQLWEANLWLVVPAITGLCAVHLVAAAGWRAILTSVGGPTLPWRRALSDYYVAQAVGGITPANIGGDIHRVVSLRDGGQGWQSALDSVVIQRATSYLALSVISLAGLYLLAARAQIATGVVIAGVAFALSISVASWLLLRPPAPLRGIHSRLVRSIGGVDDRVGRGIAELGAGVLLGLESGLAFHAASIGLTWMLVVAIDPGVPALPVLAALALARLALAVPFSPSGLGVQEGMLSLLFVGLGLPPNTAVAAMLFARISLVLTTAFGATLMVRSHSAGSAQRPVVV
jgi:uncharacterized protein (TIRG00374 family)